MIDIHSKHDNMNKNEMFYALICINKHIISCVNYMLLVGKTTLVRNMIYKMEVQCSK